MPETDRALTCVFGKPLFTEVQIVPLLVDRKTPPPEVPAKIYVPKKAKDRTYLFVKPLAVQLVPLFVDRKTPSPPVPAKRYMPERAKDWTVVFVKPLFTEVQLVPLFVDRKTPPPVPAKKCVPDAANE